MKTASRVTAFAVLATFAFSLVPALAGAALFSDSFTYPDGALTANGAGTRTAPAATR